MTKYRIVSKGQGRFIVMLGDDRILPGAMVFMDIATAFLAVDCHVAAQGNASAFWALLRSPCIAHDIRRWRAMEKLRKVGTPDRHAHKVRRATEKLPDEPLLGEEETVSLTRARAH